MTIALGLHLNGYVLLAADTRVTWHVLGKRLSYRDDSQKVNRTSLGIITGAGYSTLLDAVETRLNAETPRGTAEMVSIMQYERKKFQPDLDSIGMGHINTGWITTYRTPKNGGDVLRLAINHPAIDNGADFEKHLPGSAAMIAPAEATQDESSVIYKRILDQAKAGINLDKIGDAAYLNTHLQAHCILLARLLGEIAPKYPSISSKFQVGVHVADGRTGISNLSDTNLSTLKLSMALVL